MHESHNSSLTTANTRIISVFHYNNTIRINTSTIPTYKWFVQSITPTHHNTFVFIARQTDMRSSVSVHWLPFPPCSFWSLSGQWLARCRQFLVPYQRRGNDCRSITLLHCHCPQVTECFVYVTSALHRQLCVTRPLCCPTCAQPGM